MSSKAVIIGRDGNFKCVDQFVQNIECMAASAMLINLVKEAGDRLEYHYGGWGWIIIPDEHGGIVDICADRISSRLVYTLHIPTLENDPTLKCVVRAGGEYLERFGFRRIRYSYEEWKRREQHLGQFIPDVSDLPKGMQRSMRTDRLRTALKTGHAALVCENPDIAAAVEARGALLHGA